MILVLKTWVGLRPWKKWGAKYRVQKAGCKKQGHSYPKREEVRLPLLFLNKNDPVFFTLLFSGPYFGPDFFQGRKPTHVFKTRIVDADWLGNCLNIYILCRQGKTLNSDNGYRNVGTIRINLLANKFHCKNYCNSLVLSAYTNFTWTIDPVI